MRKKAEDLKPGDVIKGGIIGDREVFSVTVYQNAVTAITLPTPTEYRYMRDEMVEMVGPEVWILEGMHGDNSNQPIRMFYGAKRPMDTSAVERWVKYRRVEE